MKPKRTHRQVQEEKAAKLIVKQIKILEKKKENILIGLVGGSSVSGVLTLLNQRKDISWEKIHFFLLDERKVPINSSESNYYLIKQFLRANIHPYTYDRAASHYYNKFLKYGEKFDIILLSAGEDGHVASLFPNHISIESQNKGYINVNKSPKPPEKRISASSKLIKKSGFGILLFFGKKKKEAYKKYKSRCPLKQCPAKLIQKIKKHYVLTDFS